MRRIGALVFEGFEMLDYFGPLQMFSMYRDEFEIVCVAETKDRVRASGGPAVVPECQFSEDRSFDMILVPGGQGTRRECTNPAVFDWLRRASDNTEIVASVCTGSLLLACAGLLDQRKATTNKRAFDWVVSQTPNTIDWQFKARWVEDGKLFTSSGVSAGMDMSLAIIARLLGPEAAKDAALWAEYTAHTDADLDPFATRGSVT